MTERERLIEILLDGVTFTDQYKNTARMQAEYLADHLLSNGVILPPVRLGQIVWWAERYYKHPQQIEVTRILYDEHGYDIGGYTRNQTYRTFMQSAIGEYVYLTKEEAEKVLKERSEGK